MQVFSVTDVLRLNNVKMRGNNSSKLRKLFSCVELNIVQNQTDLASQAKL